jgi:hypothetical protein
MKRIGHAVVAWIALAGLPLLYLCLPAQGLKNRVSSIIRRWHSDCYVASIRVVQ